MSVTVTAAQVNELRNLTGAGLMDCKKALTEANGDVQGAIDYLRKKGAKVAELRAGRAAAEGVVIAKPSEQSSCFSGSSHCCCSYYIHYSPARPRRQRIPVQRAHPAPAADPDRLRAAGQDATRRAAAGDNQRLRHLRPFRPAGAVEP